MKNSKDFRIVKINGKERFFYLRNICAWRPDVSSNSFADAIFKKPRHQPVPVHYLCPFCTDSMAGEEVFEKIPTKEKVLINIYNARTKSRKNSILKTNARRKEKRIINFPNVRRSSQLVAAQIRAAI